MTESKLAQSPEIGGGSAKSKQVTDKLSKAALKNYQKAVKLTLEKSAPCRQRRYGMKNYDMS